MVSKIRADEFSKAIDGERQFSGLAVVVETGGPVLQMRSMGPPRLNDVVVQVEALGLCRTDLRVFAGQIPVSTPLVPGHEFAGVIANVGKGVKTASLGDRVVVNPVLACGRCEFCDQSPTLCQQTQFLGVDLDGACAEFMTVPASAVFRIPDSLAFNVAAFAEPVAASLAVLNASLQPQQRGVVLGSNRIATLTRRILQAHGFEDVVECSEQDVSVLTANSFDFAIETFATSETIRHLIRSLRPRGTLVLKSRLRTPIELTIAELLPKQLRIECVNYGAFPEAIDLLSSGKVNVNDLIGPEFALADFDRAFAHAMQDESVKTFIAPGA